MATFTTLLDTYILRVSSSEGGSVVVPGGGAFVYEAGTEVRAVALPDAGYTFLGWTGTLVDTGAVADPGAGGVDFVIEADETLHAEFAPAACCLYVDDDAAGDPLTESPLESDPAEDGTWEHPFDSVQEAIDAAATGDAVLVLPGTYREHISFQGKDVTVSALDRCGGDAVSRTILAGVDANSVVVFAKGESAAAVLAGFTILGGRGQCGGGIRCQDADPIIANCLIVGNRADLGAGVICQESRATLANCTIADNYDWQEGGGLYCCLSDVTVINSIFSGNQPEQIVVDPSAILHVIYSAVRGGWPGEGNLDYRPCFVNPGCWSSPNYPEVWMSPDSPKAVWTSGDYHLQAKAGHWDGSAWVNDSSTSPCVDAGSPYTDVGCESLPNGARINMGAFGGTAEASLSPSGDDQQQ